MPFTQNQSDSVSVAQTCPGGGRGGVQSGKNFRSTYAGTVTNIRQQRNGRSAAIFIIGGGLLTLHRAKFTYCILTAKGQQQPHHCCVTVLLSQVFYVFLMQQ